MSHAGRLDVTVPLSDILNANPKWLRIDMETPSDLIASIKQDGLQLPVLLQDDYLLLDGGRRVVALRKLGWKHIPAVVTSDWATVRDYFVEARHLEAQGLPHKALGIRELEDLVTERLGPISKEDSNRRAVQTRRENARRAARGEPPLPPVLNGYTRQLVPMLAMKLGDLCVVRDTFSALREATKRLEATDGTNTELAEQVARAKKLIKENDEAGASAYSIHGAVKAILNGQKITSRRTKHLGGTEAKASMTPQVPKPDPRAAAQQELALLRLIELFEGLSEEVFHVDAINPALSQEHAQNLANRYRIAMRKFSRLSTLLKNHTTQSQSKEKP